MINNFDFENEKLIFSVSFTDKIFHNKTAFTDFITNLKKFPANKSHNKIIGFFLIR